VVVVNNDELVLRALQRGAPRAGVRLTTVRDPQFAPEMIRQAEPHLVVIDYHPGIELCRRVRAELDEIKVVLASALVTDELIRHASAIGVAVIAKPFSLTRIAKFLPANQPSARERDEWIGMMSVIARTDPRLYAQLHAETQAAIARSAFGTKQSN
jgi:DNA-binding response OmpR family regulator